MTIYYTSDLHIGHKLVAGKRGFWNEDDVDEEGNCAPDYWAHDKALAEYWDRTVKASDSVFILGDVGISRFEQHVLPWFDGRKGSKHLITGNHDPVHPSRSDALKLQMKWLNTFDSINPYLTRKISGQKVILSHFPYESWGEGPERGGIEESRWNEWRIPEELGKLLLHGHTHGQETIHDRQFHVGWDAHKRFVTHEEIVEWVQSFSIA